MSRSFKDRYSAVEWLHEAIVGQRPYDSRLTSSASIGIADIMKRICKVGSRQLGLISPVFLLSKCKRKEHQLFVTIPTHFFSFLSTAL